MTSADEPVERRLLAAISLGAQLRDFEPLLVADARAEGASWRQIGEALGITRQAAQQRYG